LQALYGMVVDLLFDVAFGETGEHLLEAILFNSTKRDNVKAG
jgi:hypothetical protein